MRAIYLQVLAPVIMGSGRGMGRGAVGLVDGGVGGSPLPQLSLNAAAAVTAWFLHPHPSAPPTHWAAAR